MPTTNLTSQQQRVYDWLHKELDLPVFAEAYLAAVHLLEARTPGYITLVAHVGRDFTNSLARTFAGTKSRRVDYPKLVNDVSSVWRDEWGDTGLLTGDNDHGRYLVTHEAYTKVRNLLDEHEAGSDRSNLANFMFFSSFLDYDDIDRIPVNLVDEWKEARNWFQKYAHCRRGCFSADEQCRVEMHFQTLHSMLYDAARSTYERLKEVNDILEETNS